MKVTDEKSRIRIGVKMRTDPRIRIRTKCYGSGTLRLKVPKREIFETELIILSDPIWIGDLRTKAKNRFVSIVRLLSGILFFYR